MARPRSHAVISAAVFQVSLALYQSLGDVFMSSWYTMCSCYLDRYAQQQSGSGIAVTMDSDGGGLAKHWIIITPGLASAIYAADSKLPCETLAAYLRHAHDRNGHRDDTQRHSAARSHAPRAAPCFRSRSRDLLGRRLEVRCGGGGPEPNLRARSGAVHVANDVPVRFCPCYTWPLTRQDGYRACACMAIVRIDVSAYYTG